MGYIIKQRVNDPHALPPHAYKEEYANDYSSVCIICKDDFYGITDDDSNELIPCEYDNITIIGFGLFQLVKNGKLGLAHLRRKFGKGGDPFVLKRLISCEYDVIVCPWHEEIVILRKDEPMGMRVCAYFTYTEEITDWYSNYEILDRDIVELRNSDGSYLYDARKGKMFLHHKNKSLFSFDASLKNETAHSSMKAGGRGIVILAYGRSKSAIYYTGKRTRQYFYEGELHPIYKKFGCYDGHRPAVDGFLFECGNNIILLSADCKCKGRITYSDPRKKQ